MYPETCGIESKVKVGGDEVDVDGCVCATDLCNSAPNKYHGNLALVFVSMIISLVALRF